ncbi:hypothetical protein GGF48_004561 [Coemansia sp. RSA 921]|nr:hypothetical protein GGF48_004561 [Coemansia sp. RSA 921]
MADDTICGIKRKSRSGGIAGLDEANRPAPQQCTSPPTNVTRMFCRRATSCKRNTNSLRSSKWTSDVQWSFMSSDSSGSPQILTMARCLAMKLSLVRPMLLIPDNAFSMYVNRGYTIGTPKNTTTWRTDDGRRDKRSNIMS